MGFEHGRGLSKSDGLGLGWRARGRLGRPSCKIQNSLLDTLPTSQILLNDDVCAEGARSRPSGRQLKVLDTSLARHDT